MALAGIVDHRAKYAVLVVATLVVSFLAQGAVRGDSLVAPIWPAAGAMAGTLLLVPRSRTVPWSAVWLPGILVVHLAGGVPPLAAAGAALVCVLESQVVRRLLLPADGGVPSLLDDGDVSRTVRAIAAGAGTAALGYAVVAEVAGQGDPALTAIAVLGTHSASLMVLLPLFLRTPTSPALASVQERALQWGLALSTTVVVFLSSDIPPLVFVVMPMFAWLGFRGTLREASLLLSVVAVVTTVLTAWQVGPVWGLESRYDLAPELASGFLQIFLIDCGLILLPLSVAVAQQRHSAAEVASGRETLERLVASATGTAIIALDEQGRVTLFNPGAERMLGVVGADVMGSGLDRFHPADELARLARVAGTRPRFIDICRALVAGGEPRQLWRFVRADGEERAMLLSLAAVPDADGRTVGFLATAEDVTERERAREALVRALEHQAAAVRRLEELDQTKTDFVSTVSHELRTPITNIVGYTEMLEDGAGGELTATQRDFLGRVSRNSGRLLVLIEDLLTLSRIESSALELQLVGCDLASVVADAYEGVQSSVTRRDLEMRLELPEGPVPIQGDPRQLERLLVNLLTNAVKFTPDGGRVTLRLDASDDVVDLTVSDDGVGIPEAEQSRLFTRFFRSSTATAQAIQGTGLGLSIVKTIVTLHRGEIDISSAPGKGTVVSISLPRSANPAPQRSALPTG